MHEDSSSYEVRFQPTRSGIHRTSRLYDFVLNSYALFSKLNVFRKMSSRDRGGHSTVVIQTTRKPRVSVCTSAQAFNVQAFIDALILKFAEVISDVRYFELPYNNIDRFRFRNTGIDVMILCHSINNRRFSITDVMDALYDKFLHSAVRSLGKEKICVLVHDFPEERFNTADKYRAEMENFRRLQGTTFQCASLVMMCGRLDERVELGDNQWEQLRAFLMDAGQSPESISTIDNWPDICIDVYDMTNEFCRSVMKTPQRQIAFVLVISAVGLMIVLLVVFND